MAPLSWARRRRPLARHFERPESVLLGIAMGVLAAIGWLVDPFWLAVVIALQLATAGLGGVYLIGPAQPGLGFARYTTLAMAGVALTLFGRLLPAGTALLLAPLAAVVAWSVLWLELRFARRAEMRLMLDLALVGILFAGAAGVRELFAATTWQLPFGLVLVLAAILSLRAAEARGWSGIEAGGQALLQLLAVAQLLAAVSLLNLPGLVAPAIVALVFHAWGGAADALSQRASYRSVLLEFGALGLLALVVALFLHRPL
jgi:hypothetical protein